MKNSTISKVVLLSGAMFVNTMYGQRLESKRLLFDEAYTKNELKSANDIIRCASVSYEKYLQDTNPNRLNDSQFESWIKPIIEKEKTNKSISNGIVTIPVVVHVIHSGQAYGVGENITDEQVQSQITVMNNDFRRAFGTPGYNTNSVGADTMIQFALAKVDQNGNPTNGINRVNLCKTFWTTTSTDNEVKPLTIWNPTQYMNMWSVRLGGSSTGILGYAQFPSNPGISGVPAGGSASRDGVVANFATFGSTDYGNFPMTNGYNKGRTMTHEVGHFLGLRHIWGDDNDSDPNGLVCATDYCDDTPPAHKENYVCNPSIASCTPETFEMVQNYMDYTNDTCMNIFTNDQKSRITAVMNNSPRRVDLKTSQKDVAIPLFANDAELKAERICSSSPVTCGVATQVSVPFSLYNRGTSALTSAVITYTVNGGVPQTFNWAGNLAQDKYEIINLTINSSSYVTAEVSSVNGVADQRATNNLAISTSGNLASSALGSTTVNFKLQPDFYGTETSWTLTNSAGAVVKFGGPYSDGIANSNSQIVSLPAVVNQTWNLTPDCYTFTINDSFGDGIALYGSYELKDASGNIVISEGAVNFGFSQSKLFSVLVLGTQDTKNVVKNDIQIYPNPATDVINVTKVSDKATFKIFNAAGQLVNSGTINDGKINVTSLIKGTYIISINDKNVENFNSKFIKK